MTPQPLPNRTHPFHDRLTVVATPIGGRGALTIDPGEAIHRSDLVAAAERVAGQRAPARAAALERAETRARAARLGREHAKAQLEAVLAEIAERDEAIRWCSHVVAHRDELYAVVADAAAQADGHKAALTAAKERLERVVEQRVTASAAVAVAERELSALPAEGEAGGSQRVRDQIGAVLAAIAEAETRAHDQVDAAAVASAEADLRWDKAAAVLATTGRHGRDLALALPEDVRPALGPRPLDGFSELLDVLRVDRARIEQQRDATEIIVAQATADADAAAAQLASDRADIARSPLPADLAAALAELARRREGPVVVDGAVDDLDPSARAAVLDAVVDLSAEQPAVVLTDDADVLGWAIAQPAAVATVVTGSTLAGAPTPHPSPPSSE